MSRGGTSVEKAAGTEPMRFALEGRLETRSEGDEVEGAPG